MPRPACPKCREQACSRKKRLGLFQRFILPRLGWFPWQCGSCQRVFLVKERGKSKRKKHVPGSVYDPWQQNHSHNLDKTPQQAHESREQDEFLDD
jgi:hypothetical protein